MARYKPFMSCDHAHAASPGSKIYAWRKLGLADVAATAALARKIAAVAGPGDIIALSGELGAGKTTFARHFIHALGVTEEVPSPTFTLVQTYNAPAHGAGESGARGDTGIWHFDLFRIETPEEILELGMEDAFRDGISLIEWPEKLGSLLPADHLEMRFEYADARGSRSVRLRRHGSWRQRLERLGEPCDER